MGNNSEALELLKSLGLGEEDLEIILKSPDINPEAIEKAKKAEDEEAEETETETEAEEEKMSYEDMEKAYSKMKGDYEKLKGDYNKLMSASSKKDKDEKVEKSEYADLIKSVSSKLDENINLIKSLKEENDLLKSENEGLKKETPAPKSTGFNRLVIEKGMTQGFETKEGSLVLSERHHRSKVKDLLIKSIDEEQNETIRKSLEVAAANFDNPMEGEGLASDAKEYLEKNKNVKFV